MNLQADQFFQRSKKWEEEYLLLREIVTENKSLEEDFKWKHPCYLYEGKNVVLIHGFKDYRALLFVKGALLKDPRHLLVQQTKNVQSARQMRFQNIAEIEKLRPAIKAFVKEAVEIEKSGRKVLLKSVEDYPVPDELKQAFGDDGDFKKAFYRLTPGRQKGYLVFFGQAKQSATRRSRIEKKYDNIIKGKGLMD